ncbi:MAG TPA: hypothetical protein VHZ33_06885 [Trebonia sp.]|jgi:hypothetical protein|nr:hypothetical protein [Trebonia sp.]
MAQVEPDIAALFAPLRPARASSVVLSEAREVLTHLHKPIDAELWGSDIIGALSGVAPEGAKDAVGGDHASDVMAELAASLVPAAEESATPEALALLRILAAIGSPALMTAAAEAAERVTAGGVADPDWAPGLGEPTVGQCWHYGDVGGRQESITVSFGYGDAEHALSVLIDHGQGGKIKDAWVDDAAGLLDKTWMAAENDPLIIFEPIEPADARTRLQKAVAAGECPGKPDEVDDLTAHRALLRARVRYLATAA